MPSETFLNPSFCRTSSSEIDEEALNLNVLIQKRIQIIDLDSLQFGILIPAGIILPANVTTSSEVKSGLWNLSFSNSRGHGSRGISSSALSTNAWNFLDISLFTRATKPSYSALLPWGSRYDSMNPIYLWNKRISIVLSQQTKKSACIIVRFYDRVCVTYPKSRPIFMFFDRTSFERLRVSVEHLHLQFSRRKFLHTKSRGEYRKIATLVLSALEEHTFAWSKFWVTRSNKGL